MLEILLVVGIASLVSALCSLWEAALYSIPASRIEAMRDAGDKGAERLAKLRENIDEPISAILTLNTFSHTIGASVAGALVEQVFGKSSHWPLLIFSVAFSIEILLLTEILPKTAGVLWAHRVAPASARYIQWTIYALWPLVKGSAAITKALTRKGEGASHGSQVPTEEDILAMAKMGASHGTLLKEEALWASNALLLNAITVKELMTPRTVVYSLPEVMPLSMVKAHSAHWTHSRLPITDNHNPDIVTGILHRRDVFDALVQKSREELEKITLQQLARPVTFVPETLRGNEVLKRFIETRQQLFVVLNEFGGMEGIVTLEDVLEFLLGAEIVDPHDRHEDMQEYARRVAQKRKDARPGA